MIVDLILEPPDQTPNDGRNVCHVPLAPEPTPLNSFRRGKMPRFDGSSPWVEILITTKIAIEVDV